MPLSASLRKQVERDIEHFLALRRPPEHIRPLLDIGCRLRGQSVEVFEIRPVWKKEDEFHEIPVAKARYVSAAELWGIYWMRSDLRWHRYDPMPQVGSLRRFFEVVNEDPYGCFFG